MPATKITPAQLSDQARLAVLAVNKAGRTALKLALKAPFSRWMAGVPTAYHLLILPQDLRTGDPSFAVELYEGYFGLAGATAPVGSEIAVQDHAALGAVAEGALRFRLA